MIPVDINFHISYILSCFHKPGGKYEQYKQEFFKNG